MYDDVASSLTCSLEHRLHDVEHSPEIFGKILQTHGHESPVADLQTHRTSRDRRHNVLILVRYVLGHLDEKVQRLEQLQTSKPQSFCWFLAKVTRSILEIQQLRKRPVRAKRHSGRILRSPESVLTAG